MDKRLNWGSHLQYFCLKLAKSVGLLKVAFFYSSLCVLMTIFYAFIISRVRYGVVIWGNTFNSYLHPIHMMYNKAIRIISSAHPLSHILSLVRVCILHVKYGYGLGKLNSCLPFLIYLHSY